MNWLFIAVVIVLAGFAAAGYWKGFLKIVYSLVAWLLILAFVTWSTPFITGFLKSHTGVYDKITFYCEETIRKSVEERLYAAPEQLSEASQADIAENTGALLPESVIENILQKTAGAAGNVLETGGVYTEMAKGMADFIVQGLAFFIALAAATFAAIVISGLIGIISKIPVLSGINRIFGVFAGILNGLLLVWVAFYVIALFSTGEKGATLVCYIYESKFLLFLYENNPILETIVKFL